MQKVRCTAWEIHPERVNGPSYTLHTPLKEPKQVGFIFQIEKHKGRALEGIQATHWGNVWSWVETGHRQWSYNEDSKWLHMKCWHELPVCRTIFLSLLSCMLLSWHLSRTKPGSGGPHYLPTSVLILWGQLQTICTQAWDMVGCTRGQEVQTAWGLAQWPDLTVTQWTRPRQATQEKQWSSYIWHILQDVKFYLRQKNRNY